MINIKNTLIAAFATASITMTTAFAGMSFGVVGSSMDINATGTETDRLTATGTNVADTSIRNKAVSDTAMGAAIYVEYTMSDSAWPLVFGAEYTPGEADISGKLTRSDTETSQTGNEDHVSTLVTRTASASASNMSTAYIEAPLFKGLYVKGGIAHITVDHQNDSGMNGSTALRGTNVGAGYKTETPGGFMLKVSYEETDYDTLDLRSTGSNSVTANSTGVTAEVDTKAYRFSVGKAF